MTSSAMFTIVQVEVMLYKIVIEILMSFYFSLTSSLVFLLVLLKSCPVIVSEDHILYQGNQG